MDTRLSNKYWLRLRLTGSLPKAEELERLLDLPIQSMHYRDQPTIVGTLLDVDVAVFRISEWFGDQNSAEMLSELIEKLLIWTPILRGLVDKHDCHNELFMSAFRDTDQGGIVFPLELIQSLSVAKLTLHVSIQSRFLWDTEDEKPSP